MKVEMIQAVVDAEVIQACSGGGSNDGASRVG